MLVVSIHHGLDVRLDDLKPLVQMLYKGIVEVAVLGGEHLTPLDGIHKLVFKSATSRVSISLS